MSASQRAIVLRAFGFLVLFVAGQWTLRLGAREASLVEWYCNGGECSTDDFAGAAPVLGVIVMFAAAFVLLPAGRKHFVFGVGLFFAAGATLVGFEEGVSAGIVERDGPAGFMFFGGVTTSTLEIVMAVLAGFGLVVVAVLAIRVPHLTLPEKPVVTTATEDDSDNEAAQTARVIAQLTRLRESGEIDQATYDTAMGKLLR